LATVRAAAADGEEAAAPPAASLIIVVATTIDASAPPPVAAPVRDQGGMVTALFWWHAWQSRTAHPRRARLSQHTAPALLTLALVAMAPDLRRWMRPGHSAGRERP
tara:strand:+ start:91 stop:408 length:318 start_codon:yes stop_codon:yes gene_type:complete